MLTPEQRIQSQIRLVETIKDFYERSKKKRPSGIIKGHYPTMSQVADEWEVDRRDVWPVADILKKQGIIHMQDGKGSSILTLK